MCVKYKFDFSKEKDLILKTTRGVGFEDVIDAYKRGKKLSIIENRSKLHKGQRLLVVNINNYAFAAPYVIDKKRKRFFLKTVHPSRKLTEKYILKQK